MNSNDYANAKAELVQADVEAVIDGTIAIGGAVSFILVHIAEAYEAGYRAAAPIPRERRGGGSKRG